jgi:hypothetical protein
MEVLEDRLALSTYTVNSLLDANPPAGAMTLRQAIVAANADGNTDPAHPDVINFSVAGTITLASPLPALTGSVSVQGPGQASLTITGDQQGDPLLSVAPGAAAAVSALTLDGSAFVPGFHNQGVLVGQAASLSLLSVTVQSSFANYGGALDDRGGVVSLDLCSFPNDFAEFSGGAIAVEGGSLTASRSSFSGDQALSAFGGAIYLNSANADAPASASVRACTFDNDAAQEGGGIGLFNAANATVLDSTFTADYGANFGGAIALSPNAGTGPDALTLSGSTLDGNTSFQHDPGAGLYVAKALASATLRDDIIANNLAGKLPADVAGPIDPASAFNLIGDGSALTGISNGANGNQVGTDAAPIDPLLGPLQDNGGPTLTQALLPGSPALDAGSGESTADTDQRGISRVRVIDVGAYQATASQLVLTTASPATAGEPQSVTVTALDLLGNVAYDDLDTVSFASSDPKAILPSPAALSGGTVSALLAFGTPGTQWLTATDAGINYTAIQSGIVVQAAPALTSLTASVNPSTYSQAVTFTASVEANVPDDFQPTGSVTFLFGTKKLGVVPLVNGNAALTYASLPAGGDAVTAVYSGDSVFATSTSAVLTQTVNKATTAATLNVSPIPTGPGQPITLTANVSRVAPATGIPGGTVTFRDGLTTLGTGRLDGSGNASLPNVVLGIGTHKLTAVWGGDSNDFGVTSPAVTVTVPGPTQQATTTTLTVSAPTSVYGQAVTFTATVTGPGGTPTGTVTFMDGTKKLGSSTLSGGSASLTYASLTAGTHNVTAVYGGDTMFLGSTSAPVTETVTKATSTTQLTVSPPTSTYGQTVTLTAVVSIVPPGGGVPGGTITFRDGTKSLGTARLNSSGVATLQTSALSVGTHNLTAVWGGDSNNFGSTSPAVIEVVNPAAPANSPFVADNLAGIPDADLIAMLISLTDPRNRS